MRSWNEVSKQIQLRTIPLEEMPALALEAIYALRDERTCNADLLRVIEVFQSGVDRVAERRNGKEVPDDSTTD